jgi:hypothetical protein
MQLLDLFGPEKSTIVEAPWKQLNINESNIRTQTNESEYMHPKEICNKKTGIILLLVMIHRK